jgi:predicted amidophosphoribosyltransferase
MINMIPDIHTLKSSLMGDLCPICGKSKRPAQTLCPHCYSKLPLTLRRKLYDRIGQGYEQAIEAAMKHLKTEFFITKVRPDPPVGDQAKGNV